MLDIFQPMEFSLSKFDRLDPSYETLKARIRWVGRDSVIGPFYAPKHFFQKTFKISAPNSIFSKWAKILLFKFGLFQQVFNNLKLNNLAKEARRLKLKIEFEECKLKIEFEECSLKIEFEERSLKIGFEEKRAFWGSW